MKSLFIALFLCLAMVAPAGSQSEKPFLAVFCNNTPNFIHEWKNIKPDLMMESGNWEDFKLFITQIERLSGDNPVLLDINSHGTRCNHLYIDNPETGGAETTFGYILNQVDRLPEGKVEAVLSEACFAGVVYHNSIRDQKKYEEAGTIFENYNGVKPKYPVVGVSNVYNFGNAIYRQYTSGESIEIYDLRRFDAHDPGKPVEDKARENAIVYFYKYQLLLEILNLMLDKD